MTELLYLPSVDAAYVVRFTARVQSLPPGGVVLDRTAFYPTGGGQPCDLGRLELPDGTSLTVTDVSKSGPTVVHRVARRGAASAGPSIGTEVVGHIDWPRRHRHMRLHTLQHLLSARLFVRTGLRTRRATLGASRAEILVEGPWPISETETGIREDLLAHLEPPRAVQIRWLPRAEYERDPGARSGLVPLPAQVDPVRVVEIDAADRCPCGGTHLRSTGEVGGFAIEPIAVRSDGARVSFTLAEAAPPTPSA